MAAWRAACLWLWPSEEEGNGPETLSILPLQSERREKVVTGQEGSLSPPPGSSRANTFEGEEILRTRKIRIKK